MDANYLIVGLLSLPIYIYVLAKVAARAWFSEEMRYQNRFINELKKES